MAVLAVVGGQYGSEGKGVIVSHLSAGADCAVRTGGPNAGHSIKHEGRVWKMRSIPCSWINPRCALIIGPGAVLNPAVLIKEADALEEAGYSIRKRLLIDQRATIITADDVVAEAGAGLEEGIGSTLEGVGYARIRRIGRDPHDWVSAKRLEDHGFTVGDTLSAVNAVAVIGDLLLEGTQGYGLSLTTGDWPFVTSHNTTAAQLQADAGLGLMDTFETMIVYRSFPIRVGGNSGPMFGEMEWSDFPGVEPERTTVTNRVRRIGHFDWDMAKEAAMVNGASEQALTFADYLDPSIAGTTSWAALTPPVREFIDKLESSHGIPVALVGTGGPDWSVIAVPPAAPVHSGYPIIRQDHPLN